MSFDEYVRITVVIIGSIAFILMATQVKNFWSLLDIERRILLLGVILYQVGSVYGNTEAFIRETPLRPATFFIIVAHSIFVYFGLHSERKHRIFLARSKKIRTEIDQRSQE